MSGEKHKLKYQMGNLGDIIKHGVLAEVAEWWGKQPCPLVYADTFAGLPCAKSDSSVLVQKAIERLSGLEGTAISRVYAADKTRYLGSATLVKRISENFRPKPRILASDNCQAARRGLRDAGLDVIDLPNCNDGYTVLDDEVRRQHAQSANLILIDPYNFLSDEYHNGNCRLQKIKALAENNVWVALFVFDRWSEGKSKKGMAWDIHNQYREFKQSLPKGTAFSLRLSRSEGNKKAYDMEVLLTSKALAGDSGEQLRENLAAFKDAVEKVLSLPITMWGR